MFCEKWEKNLLCLRRWHRRVSIAKIQYIIAEVEEYFVDNIPPIIMERRKNYYYFYAVDFFYEFDGRKKNYNIIEKLGKISNKNYLNNKQKINDLMNAKDSNNLKKILESY